MSFHVDIIIELRQTSANLRSVHNSRQPFNSLFLASSLFRASVAWAPAIAPSNEPIWHCRRRNNRRAKSNR